uniref:L-ornithine N(5)-oxygenase n=1 Tax=Paramoeba aestuarina TaxID=180227 RepID=A0A7S4PKD1_9EUKA
MEEHQVVVSCIGALHHPSFPRVPSGLSAFKGPYMHSTRWDQDVDLKGKKVVVVGSAASAVQIVPLICDDAEKVTILQRTPNWITPQKHPTLPFNMKYGSIAKFLFRWVPGLIQLHRYSIYIAHETFFLSGAFDNPNSSRTSKMVSNHAIGLISTHMKKELGNDEKLCHKMIPDFPVGCKRVLRHETFLKCCTREDVEVHPFGLQDVRAHSIIASDGREIEADVIIYATGFKVGSVGDTRIIGTQKNNIITGTKIVDDAVPTYLGIANPEYPNAFFCLGPNTGLGHNSIILFSESQAEHIARVIGEMADNHIKVVTVNQKKMDNHMEWVWKTMEHRVWPNNCSSWYQNKHGKVTTLWPSNTPTYMWMCKISGLDCYDVHNLDEMGANL